jgi:hypothetical protein
VSDPVPSDVIALSDKRADVFLLPRAATLLLTQNRPTSVSQTASDNSRGTTALNLTQIKKTERKIVNCRCHMVVIRTTRLLMPNDCVARRLRLKRSVPDHGATIKG